MPRTLNLVSNHAYNAPGYMVDASGFLSGTYVHIHSPTYASERYGIGVKCGGHISFCHVHMAITCEVDVNVSCHLERVCTNGRFICPLWNEGSVVYICKLVSIVIQLYMYLYP